MRRLLAYRSNRRTLVIATVGLACLCGAATWTALGLLHGREPAAANEPPTARTFRLANGIEIPVEEWGATYEAWERAPVIETAKARTVLELPDGDPRHFFAIVADPPRKRLFWLTHRPGPENCQIGVVNYDGGGKRIIRDRLTSSRLLVIDSQGGKLYWTSAGEAGGYTLKRSNLNGTAEEEVVKGLKDPKSISLDPAGGAIYYVDDDRIVRVPMDGGREQEVLRNVEVMRGNAWASAYDPKERRLYWATQNAICSADKTTTAITKENSRVEPVPKPGKVWNLVVDTESSSLYLGNGNGVCRCNLDGTRFERLTDDVHGDCLCAVDSAAGRLFFTTNNRWRIVNVAVPEEPIKVVKHSPPHVRRFIPEGSMTQGESLEVFGEGFTGTTSVVCIDDAEGRHLPAKFIVNGDDQLNVTVPQFSQDSTRFTVIVRTPNGVTVAVPRESVAISRTEVLQRRDKDAQFLYWVCGEASLQNLEQKVAYVESGGHVQPGIRGAVFFLKNGSSLRLRVNQGNVIYREPFTDVQYFGKGATNNIYIEVPAIRPSFVESLPAYRR